MSMLEVFTGTAAVLGGVGGLIWWLRHDGLVRLMAGLVAVTHSDPGRRTDAIKVLRCTRDTPRCTAQRPDERTKVVP
ncbi:hypothetical protein ACWIGW_44345 [Nocardia brasiliensis]|uniref:hypothetical protein n=1 Tax=Streptomyces sp. NPDC056056 TaxID=3345698 RepID=UPI0035E386FF